MLAIISDYPHEIEALKMTMPDLVKDDFVKWWQEELDYLKSLRKELDYDVLVVAYVEALEALKKSQ